MYLQLSYFLVTFEGEMYEMSAVESINPGLYQSPQPATEWQGQSGLNQNANVGNSIVYRNSKLWKIII